MAATQQQQKNRFSLLIANSKGGCGKTTLATNLASYYASHQLPVSLLDTDPQQSSCQWLKKRPETAAAVHQLSLPQHSELSSTLLQQGIDQAQQHLIIDSPAGLDNHSLNQLLRVSQVVLIPVLPSDIDIHAATRFLQTLMLTPCYRQRPKRIAVIANRSKVNTRIYAKLERFLSSLKIPFLVSLRDTQLYVQAFSQGLGIHELSLPKDNTDPNNWRTIVEWLEVQKMLTRSLPGL